MKLIHEFGMDTISLAGPMEAKLAAMKQAGFGQVMLKANDVVGHPGGLQAAVAGCVPQAFRCSVTLKACRAICMTTKLT
jgi:hypothetical protein